MTEPPHVNLNVHVHPDTEIKIESAMGGYTNIVIGDELHQITIMLCPDAFAIVRAGPQGDQP